MLSSCCRCASWGGPLSAAVYIGLVPLQRPATEGSVAPADEWAANNGGLIAAPGSAANREAAGAVPPQLLSSEAQLAAAMLAVRRTFGRCSAHRLTCKNLHGICEAACFEVVQNLM